MRAPVIATLLMVAIATACAADALEAGSRHPPGWAQPHTWRHWMNDNMSKEGITADLEAMRRVGIGGEQIFHVHVGVPSGGMTYLSERWREMMVHAVREANRVGLEVCLHNGAGWSSSGGPWLKPEHAMQRVVTSSVQVQGPARLAQRPPQPETRLGFYPDVALLAFPTPRSDARICGLASKAAFQR